MSKFGRQRKLNQFLRQSDSDTSYAKSYGKKRKFAQNKRDSKLKKIVKIELGNEYDEMSASSASASQSPSPSESVVSKSAKNLKKAHPRLGKKRGPYKSKKKLGAANLGGYGRGRRADEYGYRRNDDNAEYAENGGPAKRGRKKLD